MTGSSQLAAIDGKGGGGAFAAAIGTAGNEPEAADAATACAGTVAELAPTGIGMGTVEEPAPVAREGLDGLSLEDSRCRDSAAKLS